MSECFLLKNQYKDPREVIRASVLGFAVGDALGVPVEFLSGEELERHPVTDMQGFGTHGQAVFRFAKGAPALDSGEKNDDNMRIVLSILTSILISAIILISYGP